VVDASEQGLEPGDVVTEAAHQTVRNAQELEARLSELKRMGRTEAILTVQKVSGAVEFASLRLSSAAD